jgi:superfamily I DNA/RNA helicase
VAEYRPDPDHDAVLESEAKHLVVTAPPGTGKTFLSVRLAGGLAPLMPTGGRILLLTFSNQARTQLEREAARQLTPELRGRVDVTNYHRFFWHGVLAYRRALGLPMRLDIGSRRRREDALRRVDEELVKELRGAEGLIDCLAEHGFPELQDHRTPAEETLRRLLPIVEEEQRQGRLVFDDLGALFWSLLGRFSSTEEAYRCRYPVVIADEHQDASALQDAVVRRLARDRLVVFADQMQLIHEFRGASRERIDGHLAECDEHLTLNTAHRWHGSEELAHWLLAVRARLRGETRQSASPPQLRIEYSPADRGFNGMKPLVRNAVARAFQENARTVAVLARGNREVAELRSYLCRHGQFPRQIGSEDFEEARGDIEQLPLLTDSHTVALRALDRLEALVPTLRTPLLSQVRGRLHPEGINLSRAGADAALILHALEPIYSKGPGAYFESVVAALEGLAGGGHHLPRIEAVRALRITAEALESEPLDLDLALERYGAAVLAATYTAPRIERGLFVMTAHQAKGKEFDAIILGDAMVRFWPDDDDHRRLFYVVITRASRSWTIVAPDHGASPLLAHLAGT